MAEKENISEGLFVDFETQLEMIGKSRESISRKIVCYDEAIDSIEKAAEAFRNAFFCINDAEDIQLIDGVGDRARESASDSLNAFRKAAEIRRDVIRLRGEAVRMDAMLAREASEIIAFRDGK